MASSVTKQNRGGSHYWAFAFTSAAKERQGLPRQKWFYFSADRHKKSEIDQIRDEYERLYRGGSFDPWSDKIPAPDAPHQSMTVLSAATRKYLAHAPRELAPKTVSVATDYLSMMSSHTGDIYMDRITPEAVTGWVNSLESHHSRRSAKYHADRFFAWAQEKGIIQAAPEVKIYSTGEEKRRKTYNAITSAELAQLLEAYHKELARKLANPHTRRDLHQVYQRHEDIVQVMFYMGLRINDVIHCRPSWVMNDGRFLRIGDLHRWGLDDEYHPKSQKEYDGPVVIPPQVTEIFWRRMQDKGKYDRLFDTRYAKRIQEPMKDACKIAFGSEFCRKFSPHSLRHSCATFWLNEMGVPIQEVQRLMRHADIKTTMKYYHPSTDAHYAAFHGGQMRSIKTVNQ